MTTEDSQTEPGMDPDAVRDLFADSVAYLDEEENSEATSPFEALFAPRARVAILEVLLTVHPDKLPIAEIIEGAPVGKSAVYERIDYLTVTGVVETDDAPGGTTVYGLNTAHPIAQLLMMLKTVQTHGTTPMLLDEQFVGEIGDGYEPGDHVDDPRDQGRDGGN